MAVQAGSQGALFTRRKPAPTPTPTPMAVGWPNWPDLCMTREARYVALDGASCEYWTSQSSARGWEAACLYSGLDPHPLYHQSEYHRLCRDARYADCSADSQIEQFRTFDQPLSLAGLQMALRINFCRVNAAIGNGQLPSTTDERRGTHFRRNLPLLFQVMFADFLPWAVHEKLLRLPPWPPRAGDGSGEGFHGFAVEVPRENRFLQLMQAVGRHFWHRYLAGERATPTVEEIAYYLESELGIAPNNALAERISVALKPTKVPQGPRARRCRKSR